MAQTLFPHSNNNPKTAQTKKANVSTSSRCGVQFKGATPTQRKESKPVQLFSEHRRQVDVVDYNSICLRNSIVNMLSHPHPTHPNILSRPTTYPPHPNS
jgi:hypothetical protein